MTAFSMTDALYSYALQLHCIAFGTMHVCSHWTCLCSSEDEEAAAKRAKRSSKGDDAANVRGRVVQKGGAAAKKAKIIDLVGGSQ